MHLTVSGGITGKTDAVPTKHGARLVLGADHHYARYCNGQLQESNTYGGRAVKHRYDNVEDKVLFLKSTNSPNGQPYDREEIITNRTENHLELTTGAAAPSTSYMSGQRLAPLFAG